MSWLSTFISHYFSISKLQHLRNESIVLTWHENFPINATTHTYDAGLKDIDVETFSGNAIIKSHTVQQVSSII